MNNIDGVSRKKYYDAPLESELINKALPPDIFIILFSRFNYQELHSASKVNHSWREVSKYIVEHQELPKADKELERIKTVLDQDEQAGALRRLALRLLGFDLIDKSIEVAHMIPKPFSKTLALKHIMLNLFQRGKIGINRAIEMAHMLPNPQDKLMAFKELAISLKNKGAPNTEIEILTKHYNEFTQAMVVSTRMPVVNRINEQEITNVRRDDRQSGSSSRLKRIQIMCRQLFREKK
ncbi:F-box protein [Candidatus Protochlamydia phocaeensis]|uniref:F-box protein n=1 Tax=Candidatus Protochlamydia phocaeensis TaxID=1414722 RepID=UPI000838059C|nr:F-box protein [Candidatus Protochlamydia phocaeensis]